MTMEPQTPEELSQELERLAEEQMNDIDSEGEERARRGKQRRERVVALYAQGALRSGGDNYHAALIMLYGEELPHFDLARTFAKRATVLGEPRAWSVIAAAWDRALLARARAAGARPTAALRHAVHPRERPLVARQGRPARDR
jgi:hypothetical protein